MTTTPNTAPAEQAKALLADAAHTERFYSPYLDTSQRVLQPMDTGTAQYAAQAATAHALLAVVDELAGLRAEMRQAVGAPREDLFQLASAVRGLAAAVATSTAQDTDVAGAIRDLARTLADRMDGQADQVLAVKEAVEEGLADVTDVLEARRGGWWSRLLWWRLRRTAQARPGIADEREALTGTTAAKAITATDSRLPLDPPLPVVPAIPAGQGALEKLAYLREFLADWAVTLPDDPNRSGLRQGLAATVYDAWEAAHAVIPKVVDFSVSGPVQDAVLRLGSALEEMGPAGVPSMAAVQAVSNRLTELLKVVAAEAVAARAEVDGR